MLIRYTPSRVVESATAALALVAATGRQAVARARGRYASWSAAAYSSPLYGLVVTYLLVG